MKRDGTTFLLVEDDENDAWFVRHQFQGASGHIRLEVVHDGTEGCNYLTGVGKFQNRTEYPLPDVILLDLKMPRMSGFEFLHWLRKEAPANLQLTPVVVMSSSGIREDVRRAYLLGANSYMVKPIDWHGFKERMRNLGIYWSHVESPRTTARDL